MSSSMEAGIRMNLARIQAEASALSLSSPIANQNGNDQGQATVNFSQTFKEALFSVDHKQHIASDKMEAVETGRSDDLVGAMLSSQEASLSFSMLMQVRNKVVGAVDELIKLQI